MPDGQRPRPLFMNVSACVLLALLFVASADVYAQQPAARSRLEKTVASGVEVLVHVDGRPEPLRARLVSIANGTLVVDSGVGTQSFQFERVTLVEREGDSVINGALIGAALLGGVCSMTCRQSATWSANDTALVVGNAVMGALMGMKFDRDRKGRSIIYRRSATARVGWMLSPGSVGIALQFGGR